MLRYSQDRLQSLLNEGRDACLALESLVDSLHENKPKTIQRFISHPGSEDLIWALINMLHSKKSRIAGNAAYVLGNLAEHISGRQRLLEIMESKLQDKQKLVIGLIQLLDNSDEETVMNAAGTIGTLAESQQGREWMLEQVCIEQLLVHILTLLRSDNMWIASNSALVLARFTISEAGCSKILSFRNCDSLLTQLILCLGFDEAGRGMNSAFAIGRLCDTDNGRQRLLNLPESDKMINFLAGMLSCPNEGASKNSCFALSCLSSNFEGHRRILHHRCFNDMKRALVELLRTAEEETAWFAAMTVRTLTSKPEGCVAMRQSKTVEESLKLVCQRNEPKTDLYIEAEVALAILRRLPKPDLPSVRVNGAYSATITWKGVTHRSGFPIHYNLFIGGECAYDGRDTECHLGDLSPSTDYNARVRAAMENVECGPFSDALPFRTDEDVPSAPGNFFLDTSTSSQIRLTWDDPVSSNGVIKGFVVTKDDLPSDLIQDNTYIFSGLAPATDYHFTVSAVTGKGKGSPAELNTSTQPLGAHAPSKPLTNALGRCEIGVSWQPPEVPLGRLTRYELLCDGMEVYFGLDLNTVVRSLSANTEYTFVVVAVTSAGRFESKACKGKTQKDEYNPPRRPLYTPKGSSEDCRRSSSASQSSSDQLTKKESPKKRKVRRKSIPKFWHNPTNSSELRRSKTDLTARPTTPTFRADAEKIVIRPTLTRGKTKLGPLPKTPDPDWLNHVENLPTSKDQEIVRKKISELALDGKYVYHSARTNSLPTSTGICHTILLDADLPSRPFQNIPIAPLLRSRTSVTSLKKVVNRKTLPIIAQKMQRSYSELVPPTNSPTSQNVAFFT